MTDEEESTTTIEEVEERLGEIELNETDDLYEIVYTLVELPEVQSASVNEEQGSIRVRYPKSSSSVVEEILYQMHDFRYAGCESGVTGGTVFVNYTTSEV